MSAPLSGPTAPRYTPELAERVLTALAAGLSLTAACKRKGMPSRDTVARWVENDPSFAADYAHARGLGADAMEQQLADVVHKTLTGEISPQQCHAVGSLLQWRARVMNPGVYGDRVDVKHSGAVGFGLTINARPQPKLVEDAGVVRVLPRKAGP